MTAMLTDKLIEILACPETKQPLRRATGEELRLLEELHSRGELVKVSGELAREAPVAALVREDARIAYPVVEGIPTLLVEEALIISQNLS
jgi:uncharacterized protein YbaR (Trm112 family)